MKLRFSIFALALALPLALLAKEESPSASPTPKPVPILKKWLRSLGLQTDHTGSTATGFKALDIALQLDPPVVTVGETKTLKVIVRLINRGKKIVQLDFPSSQRIEVLVKSKDGKVIEQWSEDQAFTDEPSMVTINPGERVEYVVGVSTRDMVAGETYTVDGYFPNFEQLRKTLIVGAITPPPATPKPDPNATPGPTGTPGSKTPGEPATPARHKRDS